MSHFLLSFLSFLSLVSADFASISEFIDIENGPKLPTGRVIEMYTKEDSPAGDAEPYIEIDLVAKSVNDTKVTGFFEVIILEAINLDYLRFHDERYPHFYFSFCCTQEMYDTVKTPPAPGCTSSDDINTLLIDDGKIHHEAKRVYFKDESEVKMKNQLRFSINNTGEHILILSNCDPGLQLGVQVDGEGEWRNPYGYLPGRLYGYLEFYGYMSIVYLVIGLIWFLFNAYYWTEVVMVQNCITVVLAMCMAEMTVWYFDYKAFNDNGKRDVSVVIIAIMITVSRQTLSRMLVLAVSLGWGVVRPTLGKNKFRLIILGFTYWLSETAFELVTRYSQTSATIPERVRMFLALPVAVLNAIFYWWIFIALYRITAQLEARRQESKLNLYRRFTRVLIFSLLVTVGFAIYQLYYMSTDRFLLHWSQLWLLDVGFPFIVYTIILTAIAILWRPSQNSRRYAYAEVARGTEDDGEFGDLELDDVPQPVKQHDPLGIGLEDDSEDDNGPPPAGRFTVDEEHDNMHQEDPLDDMVGVNSQPMTKLA